MENTLVKTTEEMIAHIEWSLDIEHPIQYMEEGNIFHHRDLLKNEIIVEDDLVKARKITLWSVSEEGFLLKLDQLVAITPSMEYILVQDKGYTKWGDNSEDRWNHFYLFPAEKASY